MIYVGSLKYSPVYKSHCCAFGKACEDEGRPVTYIFSREYEWMLPKEVVEKSIFVGRSSTIPSMVKDTLDFRNMRLLKKAFSVEKPSLVYLHNYHLLNHSIAKTCKSLGSTFVYHAHEPYVENKSAHGGLQQYWLYLNEFMENRLLQLTDVTIVSSSEASRLFDKRYRSFKGKKIEIPLMYEDLGEDRIFDDRIYVTFVGPPVPAKGPETFLKIVDYAGSHGLGWSFLLISRSRVNDSRFLGKANLTVFSRERISDGEYGDLIRRSLVVVTPYRRETQSSVILVSYMYGTPVVSSNVGGLPEFVDQGKTGYLVDVDAPAEEWIEKINLVREKFNRMSRNCRNLFVRNYSGGNWTKYLAHLIC